MSGAEPVYHGGDLQSAIRRARQIRGKVIHSKGPNSASPGVGWWSDDRDALVRTWEKSYTPRQAEKLRNT